MYYVKQLFILVVFNYPTQGTDHADNGIGWSYDHHNVFFRMIFARYSILHIMPLQLINIRVY